MAQVPGKARWLVLAVGALALAAGRVGAQESRATVRASVTVLAPVGLDAAAPFDLDASGTGAIVVDGALDVTSPAPHILTTRVYREGDAPAVEDFAPVRRGGSGLAPERIRIVTDPRVGVGRVRVVHTIAVVL